MCGFVISKQPTNGNVFHRGTEHTTIEINDWRVQFSSLPLSSFGTNLSQPVPFRFGYLVFNGEIFNYNELDPSSKSDLEYLQKLFIRCGENLNSLYEHSIHWDGFWSIAYIQKSGKVSFFTDWMGKKQLYYSEIGIASEIKPILPNDYSLLEYTPQQFGSLNTPFTKVFRAIPGAYYEYEPRNKRASRIRMLDYFDYPVGQDLYSMIDRSVKRRLENRIDGCSIFLSGGLDSNIVLHHLLAHTRDFEAITIENQESEIVKQIQQIYDIPVNYIEDNFEPSDLFYAVQHYEHPLDYGSLIPNYLLFQQCQNRMVLTGDGSDELFGGYTRSQTSDTWIYDTQLELPYYHNVRIDRMSMAFTKEARSPLMSMDLYRYSRTLPQAERTGKKVLRDLYQDLLPKCVLETKKRPLRLFDDKDKNMEMVKKEFKIVF